MSMRDQLTAPFPYFGGKRKVAAEVWARFGAVQNYVEPFCGSAAVLLGRPDEPSTETVNDVDCFISNFWRAVQCEPDAVAHYADWPINEADLHARHRWLMTREGVAEWRERMKTDPMFYDAQVAGWWVWGACCWIGAGWCAGGRLTDRDGGASNKFPRVNCLSGVNTKIAEVRPHLTGFYPMGVHGVMSNQKLVEWMRRLAARLRRVRVCCGDWSRVCTPAVTSKLGETGVFLDPPYAAEAGRESDIYANDDLTVAHAVREWAIANGDNPLMRIALCGYEGEHDMPPTWSVFAWKTHGGFGHVQKPGRGMANRMRERIWFSPHCMASVQGGLFEVLA
jgi:site-specific DNA-adenine methylase